LAVRRIMSIRASPASSMVISRRRMPETSTSTCSPMVRTVRGLAVILMTGTMGLPTTLPCPVGKVWTTAPPAAISVTHSAAAEDESMK
jgi:hypothetical protein